MFKAMQIYFQFILVKDVLHHIKMYNAALTFLGYLKR